MIKSDTSLIGTDVGAHLDRFFWHGAPTKILGYWRREKNLFSLEEAVHKLTGFPAKRLRLNRGVLKEGMPADITVFDADKIDDLVSKKLPDMVDAQEVQPPSAGHESRASSTARRSSKTVSAMTSSPAKCAASSCACRIDASIVSFAISSLHPQPSPSGRGLG